MSTLPPDVQLHTEGDTTRLVLPDRPRTVPRAVAIFPIGFGLVFVGFAVFWMIGAIGGMKGHAAPPPAVNPGPELPAPPPPAARQFDPFSIVFALFGLPFALAGCAPILAGLAILFRNHAEVVITATHLVSREHIGGFRIARRRPLAAVTGLVVGPSTLGSQNGGPLAGYQGIEATCAAPHKSLPLAQRYPPATVAAVAGVLASELERRRGIVTLRADAPKVPIAVTFNLPPAPAPAAAAERPRELPPPQPKGSRITFIPAADALTFMIPRAGFRGAAAFFLFFSLFWNGLTFTIAGVFAVSFFQKPELEELFVFAFLSIFIAVGVGMALAAVQTAYRKAVIVASRESLVFTQTGPIGKAEHQWAPADLVAIRVGDSGTKVNGRPLKQLQVAYTQHNAPAHRGVLTGWEEGDLRWLAATLRAFYEVGS